MDKVISVGSIQVEQPSFQFLILTTFSMSPEWIQHLALPQFPELHKLSENNRVYLDSQWTHETQCPARYEKSSFWQSKLIGFLKSMRIVKQSDSIIFFRVFLIYLVVCLCACMWVVCVSVWMCVYHGTYLATFDSVLPPHGFQYRRQVLGLLGKYIYPQSDLPGFHFSKNLWNFFYEKNTNFSLL